MKWLITGGCGFIGSSLIHKLAASGEHSIRVIDNLSVGKPESLGDIPHELFEKENIGNVSWSNTQVDICVLDILDAESAIKALEGAEVVVHLAANTGVPQSVENPVMDCHTNVIGTLNCLEAARKNSVKRFIFASSGAPVGETEPPIHEEIVPHPVSPYGASKLAGEAYCSVYYHCYGVETVALRFGNVYGPRSFHKSSVVAKFSKAIVNKEEITIYGDGAQTRDFIYIADLLGAIQASAVSAGAGGEVFQIASNKEVTVDELAECLIDVACANGFDRPKVNYSSPRLGDVARNYSDTSKARRMLNWQSSTPLEKGLINTFEWFIDYVKK